MVNNMNRKTILLLLILISICAISHVSAQDEMDLIAGDNITDIQNSFSRSREESNKRISRN